MKELMERENISKAELARRMKLSRARITQIMNLLKLNPEVMEVIKEMEDNFERPVITERRLGGREEMAGMQVNVILEILN